MATHSSGITVTWGGVSFSEVTDLQWSYGGGSSKGRSVAWTDDAGTVTLSCLGSSNMSTGNWGQRDTITIIGGGMDLTYKAIFEQVAASAELNGVTRYTATFKILDDG